MTSPSGQREGRHRKPELDPYEIPDRNRSEAATQREADRRQAEGELVREATPEILEDILSSLFNTVSLCGWCYAFHFQGHPDLPGKPCNQVKCQCWCSQGTGN